MPKYEVYYLNKVVIEAEDTADAYIFIQDQLDAQKEEGRVLHVNPADDTCGDTCGCKGGC